MQETKLKNDETSSDIAKKILRDFGYFGHYLHMNAGGRSGKGHVLIQIYKAGGEVGQKELQENCPISSASLSEVLAKLEAEELLERSRQSADRRQLSVKLTLLGHKRAEELLKNKERFEKEAFSCLKTDEQKTLIELLDRIRTSWEQQANTEEVSA